ncbi:MAG: dTDP-4-dehydrorhamnose reductase [Nocardioidaceae bacterium]
MRWLVTGAAGMLGTDLVTLLRERGEAVTAITRADLDLTDPTAVTTAVAGHDVVVNCAAWTAVDDAQEHEAEATVVNADGPRLLAHACATNGARLAHVSTDYVFDGSATRPYAEDAPTNPTSAYGRSKAAGEHAVRRALPADHLIVRTAWLYGAHGGCFPKTIARVARERGSVKVVDDQVGQPTWTADVADVVHRLVTAHVPAGTFHATSSGRCSWFDFAREVVAAAGLDPALVQRTTSADFVRPAPRPAYSVLGHDALKAHGVAPIGPWRERWGAAASEVLG